MGMEWSAHVKMPESTAVKQEAKATGRKAGVDEEAKAEEEEVEEAREVEEEEDVAAAKEVEKDE